MLSICLATGVALLFFLRRSPLGLFWRTRWLVLVLMLGYAYGLPGEPLVPFAGYFSPSLEGLIHGGRQALSLLVLLLWLDILVLAQASENLLGGLYQLARPLAFLGLDSGRIALRLGLTLKAIEGIERGRGNLMRLLTRDVGTTLPERVHIEIHHARLFDLLVPMVLLAGMVGLWLSA